ncbi:hypothetical protein GYMLUDRAFT_247084 [Collybiopsis luxurians FD-317 M1]|uniref:C2H2-type domain-containing protein n=1 Tax=Collybiopsis luxurians FD-317 M1 TaxID=944289 RepID=A0A0D0BQN0_9AGAR|nr:hypothetical protein GYMLUDRAFT_247084 [Collybiopsis luxurians FD-317 M1]
MRQFKALESARLYRDHHSPDSVREEAEHGAISNRQNILPDSSPSEGFSHYGGSNTATSAQTIDSSSPLQLDGFLWGNDDPLMNLPLVSDNHWAQSIANPANSGRQGSSPSTYEDLAIAFSKSQVTPWSADRFGMIDPEYALRSVELASGMLTTKDPPTGELFGATAEQCSPASDLSLGSSVEISSRSSPQLCSTNELAGVESPTFKRKKETDPPNQQPGSTIILNNNHPRQKRKKSQDKQPRVYHRCTMGCSELFSRRHDRLRHEVSKHGRECQYSCNQCGKFFSMEISLEKHQGKCSGLPGGLRWAKHFRGSS